MSEDNTHFIQITGTSSGLLSAYPDVSYFDGFYFNSINASTFSYPTTTYGGTLTAGILPDPIPVNWDGGVTFTEIASGGVIKNYSYEDFSKILSKFYVGNYFCTPTLVLSFSTYDESKSFVKRITYTYKDKTYSITPEISSFFTFVNNVTSYDYIKTYKLISPKVKTATVSVVPNEEYLKKETIYIDVIKADNTVNKLEVNFNVVQCGILDIYRETNILNTQILDDVNSLLLTLEDNNTKKTFNSIVDINTPYYLVTGGDIKLPTQEQEINVVFDIEGAAPAEETVFLAEQIQQQTLILPTIPVPTPDISPINPQVGEFYYRGERGIRVRPLLSKLLPGDKFYYERPASGLILSEGGAPYYPGKGVLYNLEFRVI